MAGYDGYSKSNNALAAESDDKYPLTHAVKRVAEMAGCTQKTARAALLEIGPTEWHHTSKNYNKTDYYNCRVAVAFIQAAPVRAALAAAGTTARINALPTDARGVFLPGTRDQICDEIATEVGCTRAMVEIFYYGSWDDLLKPE